MECTCSQRFYGDGHHWYTCATQQVSSQIGVKMDEGQNKFTFVRWCEGGEKINMIARNSNSLCYDYETALKEATALAKGGMDLAVVEVKSLVRYQPPVVLPPTVTPFTPKE